MCGLAGFLGMPGNACNATTLREMVDSLHHRGPDGSGVWVAPGGEVGLAHRRLAIMDLSEAGAQPMQSTSKRFVLAFNGEIYNHLSLRRALEAEGAVSAWAGHSDTETLVVAVEHWGLVSALRQCYGMFAFALWDRKERSLSLARDRMGEKPLYLARTSGGWAFASELKALYYAPGFEGRLVSEAVAAFLSYGYVPDNTCIFENVVKVPPGGILTIGPGDEMPAQARYHDLSDDIAQGAAETGSQPAGFEGAVRHIESVLRSAIADQMLSDVSVGCFLSGGVDSSLVAALMQGQCKSSIRTFSIGFKEAQFNEAPHAAAVAGHLGTQHTEFTVSEDDALSVVADLPWIYDEPFADSSQIPTILLCQEARQAVTVALTGDGGDEVFGGYNRHIMGPKLLRRLQQVPTTLRRQGSRLAVALGPILKREDGWARRGAAKMKLPVTALDKAIALAPRLAETRDIADLYRAFTRGIHDPGTLLREDATVPDPPFSFDLEGAEWMMAMDSVTYLPGDILVKVDRAAMASSLETRAPFLDARVVAEAWRLPVAMKIADGAGKRVLREILHRHVPSELMERPKQGFAIPLDRWLRGALRDWGEELLANAELFQIAGLDSASVTDLWQQHQNRAADFGTQLWTVLVLLDWVRAYQDMIDVPPDAPRAYARG